MRNRRKSPKDRQVFFPRSLCFFPMYFPGSSRNWPGCAPTLYSRNSACRTLGYTFRCPLNGKWGAQPPGVFPSFFFTSAARFFCLGHSRLPDHFLMRKRRAAFLWFLPLFLAALLFPLAGESSIPLFREIITVFLLPQTVRHWGLLSYHFPLLWFLHYGQRGGMQRLRLSFGLRPTRARGLRLQRRSWANRRKLFFMRRDRFPRQHGPCQPFFTEFAVFF